MKRLILSLILSLICLFSFGQVIQIGSGTSTNSITTASPVNTYFKRQVCQFVYTAAEINAAGGTGPNILSQLGFYVTNQPVYAIPGYTIKIKHTTQTNVNTALGTNGWTTVKNAFSYSPNPGGYDMLVFDTPFNWDGVQNIGVEICWSQIQPTWDASGQCRIYNSNKGYRYSQDDNAGSICGTAPTAKSNDKPQSQLIFKTSSTWNGSVSSDWFNANNWDAGVPDQDLDVTIPSSASNMPIINGAGAICKNLTINAGASLALAGSNNIDIYKNWTNNGTFIANTGNVTLKGTSVNNINGAINQDLYNLTIDNVNGAAITSGSINLHGSLNIGIATGNFNTNNALTLISNASGTGRISELTTKCLYTLNMSDTYGDSWNGAFITVVIDGVSIGTYSAKGSNSSNQFIAAAGSVVRLDYTAGIYENENSYTLKDASGTTIFSDGTTPATGTGVFTTTSNCSFFNPISGTISMQRYVAASQATWRYFTSAVSGATIADFSDDFTTTGFTGSTYPLWPTAANPWTSVYTYDETQPGVIDSGFVSATNVTNSLATGQGFWSYIFDTQGYTVDVVGQPNVGTINLPVSYTNNGTPTEDGWSMVGNPYPSAINWDSPSITKTNVNAAIYIWNAAQQQFASYVFPFGTNGGTNMIPSSQAFWVQTNGTGANLQLTESCKANSNPTFLKQNSTSPLRIKAQNNSGIDELIINFESNATNTFDINFDAKKMKSSNPLPKISSIINGIEYSINQMNPQEINIPIKILTGTSGAHNITIENANLFSNNCLILEDLFTNTFYDLLLVDSFSTYIYDTTQTARFLLHVGAPIDITKNDISCYNNNDGKLVFTKNSSSTYGITWLDSLNNVITTNNNIYVSDSLSNLSSGTYYIETTDLLCGNKVDTVIINEPSQIVAQFSSSADTVYLSNGGTINFTNLSTNAISFLWDFGDFTSSTSISPVHQYTQSGNYLVSLNSYQNPNCFETITKNITVINTATSIQNLDLINNQKVWINNDNLIISGNDISSINVKNLSGQLLFTSKNSNKEKQIFNLERLSSQILIVTTFSNDNVSSYKVAFIKTN